MRPTAFFGDKLLGAAVAIAQQHSGAMPSSDVGSLTKVHALAVSNASLHAHLEYILPAHAHAFQPASLGRAAHGAGTMVEAAVAVVHEEYGAAAVAELAEWLVGRAVARHLASEAEQTARPPAELPNAKGRVLELGGSVTAERTGGLDHAPTFTAVAELGGTRLSVTGRSKADAQQSASVRLLDMVFDAEGY